MSQEYFEELEFLEETENSHSDADDEKEEKNGEELRPQQEFAFTKEAQELQSTLNKNRLLELNHKLKAFDNNEFIIYVGETYLKKETESSETEIMFVYAKGLTKNWEFPLFVFYNKHNCVEDDNYFNVAGLLRVILKLLNIVKLTPLACILNFRASYNKMLHELGITVFNPYIEIEDKQIILCLDFFNILKDASIHTKIPPDILQYMEYFNRECENLDQWIEEFEKFKELLTNVYSLEIPMFSLYYAVAARLAALNAAKSIGCWPVKMVCFRDTKLQNFLYRIHSEEISKFDEFLKVLPDIYMEYY